MLAYVRVHVTVNVLCAHILWMYLCISEHIGMFTGCVCFCACALRVFCACLDVCDVHTIVRLQEVGA